MRVGDVYFDHGQWWRVLSITGGGWVRTTPGGMCAMRSLNSIGISRFEAWPRWVWQCVSCPVAAAVARLLNRATTRRAT